MVSALQKGNVKEAKAALEDYETGWKGIEVYVITRDVKLHQIETNYRIKITAGLNSPKPDFPVVAADAQGLLGKYDAFVATLATAPPLNPLFDDVARLRMFRASVRVVDIALHAGDFVKARAGLTWRLPKQA